MVESLNHPALDRLRQICFRESFVAVCLIVGSVAFNLIYLYS